MVIMNSLGFGSFGLLVSVLLMCGCGAASHPQSTTHSSSTASSTTANGAARTDSGAGGPLSENEGLKNLKPKASEQLEIEDLVKANLADIRRCYEHALDKSPSLKGVMTVDFEIDEGGKVLNERSSGLDHKPLEECVLGKFSSMEFPSTLEVKDKLAVSYPLVFDR